MTRIIRLITVPAAPITMPVLQKEIDSVIRAINEALCSDIDSDTGETLVYAGWFSGRTAGVAIISLRNDEVDLSIAMQTIAKMGLLPAGWGPALEYVSMFVEVAALPKPPDFMAA